MGTIFGVWPGDKLTGITGREQAAAGMGIYGPRTVFCIALKVRWAAAAAAAAAAPGAAAFRAAAAERLP